MRAIVGLRFGSLAPVKRQLYAEEREMHRREGRDIDLSNSAAAGHNSSKYPGIVSSRQAIFALCGTVSQPEQMIRLEVNKQGRHHKQRSALMPLVQIHAIKGVFSPEAKQKIIEKVTDAMVQVEGENLRGVTVVTINEIDSGDWGIGGKPMTVDAVKEIASGRYAA